MYLACVASATVITDTCSVDMVLFSEPWLSSANDFEVLHCEPGYTFYRSDHTGSAGGGVSIAVWNTLVFSAIVVDCSLEFITACIFIGHKKFIFCVCYKPPVSSTFCQELRDVLNKLTALFSKCPLFLVGEFHLSAVDWTTDSPNPVANSMECL